MRVRDDEQDETAYYYSCVDPAHRGAVLFGGPPTQANAGQSSSPLRSRYSVFHVIFALAAMYMSMLMTGWNTADPTTGELKNVGHDWTTVWVRVRRPCMPNLRAVPSRRPC